MANNSSFSMSTPTVHVILNIISLIATTIGTSLSFAMLAGVLLRKKTLHDVELILCTNNYILVFVLGIFELTHNVTVLRGDFGLLVIEKETLGCRIEAYILFSLISAVYLACVLQAIFRLCRIVYPTYLWLVESSTYLIIIPLMWIFSFVLILPLFFWHGQRLIPGEYICRVPEDDALSIAYSTLVIYGIPFNGLAFVYYQVHRFLRRQTAPISLELASRFRKQQRDVVVFRRIIIVVTLLGSYGMPNSVMLIMLAVTHDLVPSFYRILELSFAALILTLSMGILYVNPKLRKEVKIYRRQNRVVPLAPNEYQLKQHTFNRSQIKATTPAL